MSRLPDSGSNCYRQAALTICEPTGQVKFLVLLSVWVFIADTGSFWSLRSEKQMDIKLFTESFKKKKNDPSKTSLSWKTHFPLVVQNKIFESI